MLKTGGILFAVGFFLITEALNIETLNRDHSTPRGDYQIFTRPYRRKLFYLGLIILIGGLMLVLMDTTGKEVSMPTTGDLLQAGGIILVTGGIVLAVLAVDTFFRLRPYQRERYPWENILTQPAWEGVFQIGLPGLGMVLIGTMLLAIA